MCHKKTEDYPIADSPLVLIIFIPRGKRKDVIYFVVETPPLLDSLLSRASLDLQNKVRICVPGVSLGLTTALVPFALSYERGLFLSVQEKALRYPHS